MSVEKTGSAVGQERAVGVVGEWSSRKGSGGKNIGECRVRQGNRKPG